MIFIVFTCNSIVQIRNIFINKSYLNIEKIPHKPFSIPCILTTVPQVWVRESF